MQKDPKKYRKNVAIIILNREKVLFCRRKKSYYEREAWQLPQGGVEENEDLETAVHREVEEETGISDAKILGRTADFIYYDWPKSIPRQSALNDYIGQRQIYFVVQVQDQALSQLKESDEFDKFEWASIQQVLEKVVPFKRPVYEQAFNELKELLP